MGMGALSSGVKRPGREADHSPQTTAEVKKIWIYTSTLPYAFTTLVKHRNKFTIFNREYIYIYIYMRE
jgi:hypothetical protein